MAIGDFVKIGVGSIVHGVATDNVAVFELEKDQFDNIRIDMNGCVFPKPVGGVKGGLTAKIVGDPVKVQRSYVENMTETTKGFGGSDLVMLFPVYFEHYQKTAFIHQSHMHLLHGQLT
jgi:hypothetical protein